MQRYALGDICEIVSGSTPKTNIEEYWNGDIKWITPAELDEESYIINDTARKITKVAVEKTGISSFPKGTVLLSSRAPIGKVAIAGCEMYCNQGFKNLICKEKVYNRYLYWFLKRNTKYLNSLGRGATFKEISKQIVSEIEINLPEIEHQKMIVEILEKLMKIIRLRKLEIKKLEKLKNARFVEMFGDLKNTIRLGDCCKVHARIGWQALTRDEHMKTGEYMLVTGTDFIDGKINYNTCVYVTRERYEMDPHIILRENDILITKDGSIGKVAIIHNLSKPATLNSGVFVVRPKDIFNKEYISGVFRGPLFEKFIELSKTGATIKHLNQKHLVEFRIPLPTLEKQEVFARFSNQINKSKFPTLHHLKSIYTKPQLCCKMVIVNDFLNAKRF